MPTKNRIKLDFSIPTSNGRKEFVESYISQLNFQLNETEKETIANYILWGKDEDGKNGVQRKDYDIETRANLWTQNERTESLDALIESPTFDENIILRPDEVRTKIARSVFSRDEARAQINPGLLSQLEDLFAQIDRTDLLINFYDLAHNKRKNPPREELLQRFSQEELLEYQQKAQSLSQYHYLKLRHLLVDLRQQQYSLKDTYTNLLVKDPTCGNHIVNPKDYEPVFGDDIVVYPMGIKIPGYVSEKLFNSFSTLIPANFSQKELEEVSHIIWSLDINEKPKRGQFFDFTNLEHLYQAILALEDLQDAAALETLNKSLTNFINTLMYYIEIAELSEVQREILDLKIKGVHNEQIAGYVNQKYGKSYTINYISTIFRQKILPAIIEAVLYHRRICENLFFPEEFKECNTCGRVLLRDGYNFVRKSRAKDGFTNRCKACDKADRLRKKS